MINGFLTYNQEFVIFNFPCSFSNIIQVPLQKKTEVIYDSVLFPYMCIRGAPLDIQGVHGSLGRAKLLFFTPQPGEVGLFHRLWR